MTSVSRAGHDRDTLVAGTHAATSAETARETDVMVFLLPVMKRPGRSGRVQVHRREGERSSPDSGDLRAIDAHRAPKRAKPLLPDGRVGFGLTLPHPRSID